MDKFLLLTIGYLSLAVGLFAFEKLPDKYHVTFGNPRASIRIVEYFSLSCGKCIETFLKDFKGLREKYVDSGDVCWSFHPQPNDLLTLQAMACIEKLSAKEKRIFLEVLIENLEQGTKGGPLMSLIMDTLGKPVPELTKLDDLKKSQTFKTANKFLQQEDIVREFPTIEINGMIYDDFPTKKFIEKILDSLVTVKKESR